MGTSAILVHVVSCMFQGQCCFNHNAISYEVFDCNEAGTLSTSSDNTVDPDVTNGGILGFTRVHAIMT